MSDLPRVEIEEHFDTTLCGKSLVCVETPCGRVYVVMKDLSEELGLLWERQRRTIINSPLLNPVLSHKSDDSNVDMGRVGRLCLPISELVIWILGINVAKVDKEIREDLYKFQENVGSLCIPAIWDKLGKLSRPTPVRRLVTP